MKCVGRDGTGGTLATSRATLPCPMTTASREDDSSKPHPAMRGSPLYHATNSPKYKSIKESEIEIEINK